MSLNIYSYKKTYYFSVRVGRLEAHSKPKNCTGLSIYSQVFLNTFFLWGHVMKQVFSFFCLMSTVYSAKGKCFEVRPFKT
jgi:hypothetical protein